MTVLRLRRSRWRTQGRILALIAMACFLAGLGPLGPLTSSQLGPLASSPAGAAPPAAKSPPAVPALSWSTVATGTTHPPALAHAAAVYDSDTSSVVLFGGLEANGQLSDDTWVWNGSSWADYPAKETQAPPARQMASMAFDPALHQLILFGGLGADNQILGDTWAWNGASWYEEEPAANPPPREAAALAFDGSQLVLFGGTGDAASTPSTDSSANSSGDSSTTSTSAPAPATTAVASTTAATATPVVLDDTWLWTGTGWQQATVTGPSARSGAAMSYDSAKHDTVLFGGEASPAGSPSRTLLGDTWTWDGSAWKRAAPQTSPTPREDAAVADDPGAGGVILTTGSLGAHGPTGQTWLWNGTNWAQPQVSGAPGPRAGAAAAFDTDNKQLILFGGMSANAGGVDDDTWALTAAQSGSTSTGSAPTSIAGASGPTSSATPSIRPGGTSSSNPGAGSQPTPQSHRAAAGLGATATVVHRNQSVTLSGSGFAPRTPIQITFHSTPEVVGQATADGFGYFKTTVSVPATATQGSHHFEATGKSPQGGPFQLVVAVKVVRGGPPRATAKETLIMVGVALLIPLLVWLFLSGSDRMRSRPRRNQPQPQPQ